MKKTVLREYAKIIVRVGVNVQKGQEVIVYAGLDQPEFVQMVVEEAYKAKAKKVVVEWNYQPLQKIHVRYQSVKTMGTVTEWQKAKQEYFCEVIPARIHLISEDPDGLKGINMEKVMKANQMSIDRFRLFLQAHPFQSDWLRLEGGGIQDLTAGGGIAALE